MARDCRLDWEDQDLEAGVRARITDDINGLVALGCLGGRFAKHAADRLLSIRQCHGGPRFWILVSALNRGDKRTALMFLDDWSKMDTRPAARVSKFVPGDHYHVLGTKFNTLDEAQGYLHKMGYRFDGLTEKHVYQHPGD